VVTREYRYNDHGLMVWHRLPGGLESEYRWKKFDHWRVVENRTSTGDGCRFTYDLDAGLTSVEHYDGQKRQHYWNAQNLIVRYVDERGETGATRGMTMSSSRNASIRSGTSSPSSTTTWAIGCRRSTPTAMPVPRPGWSTVRFRGDYRSRRQCHGSGTTNTTA
jgi:hypothetical protein